MVNIFLSYNAFKWNELDSYLSWGIRLVCYFKNRGEHGEKILWHHCGAISDNNVYQAKLRFKKQSINEAFKGYEHVIKLKPLFDFNEKLFIAELESQIGKLYNFEAIGCQLIFQTIGWKPVKRFNRPYCSQAIAKAFYFSCEEPVRHYFKDYDYTDPQDFVRMWKDDKLFEVINS